MDHIDTKKRKESYIATSSDGYSSSGSIMSLGIDSDDEGGQISSFQKFYNKLKRRSSFKNNKKKGRLPRKFNVDESPVVKKKVEGFELLRKILWNVKCFSIFSFSLSVILSSIAFWLIGYFLLIKMTYILIDNEYVSVRERVGMFVEQNFEYAPNVIKRIHQNFKSLNKSAGISFDFDDNADLIEQVLFTENIALVRPKYNTLCLGNSNGYFFGSSVAYLMNENRFRWSKMRSHNVSTNHVVVVDEVNNATGSFLKIYNFLIGERNGLIFQIFPYNVFTRSWYQEGINLGDGEIAWGTIYLAKRGDLHISISTSFHSIENKQTGVIMASISLGIFSEHLEQFKEDLVYITNCKGFVIGTNSLEEENAKNSVKHASNHSNWLVRESTYFLISMFGNYSSLQNIDTMVPFKSDYDKMLYYISVKVYNDLYGLKINTIIIFKKERLFSDVNMMNNLYIISLFSILIIFVLFGVFFWRLHFTSYS